MASANLIITIVLDINNVESSTTSDSNNEVYNINNNNSNNFVNNSNSIEGKIRILILVIKKIIISLLIM